MVNNAGHISSLNGIRAISILMVIGSHANHSSNFPENLKRMWGYFFDGSLGVTAFFVLSGFLITYLLLIEENKTGSISLKNFYIRRTLRIFPVYYLLLLVYFILQKFQVLYFSDCQWLTSLTYTKNFGCGAWSDGHLWSLAVEEQFYIIWPITFKFLSKVGRTGFAIAVITICPVVRAVTYKLWGPDYIAYSLFTNIDCLMWGCLAAIYLKDILAFLTKKRLHRFRFLLLAPVICVLYLQKLLLFGIFLTPFSKTITSLCIILLIICYSQYKTGPVYKILNWQPLVWIGTLSYSIYIWQQLFFSPELGVLQLLPVNYILILVTAICSYYLVELPILKFKKHFQTVKSEP